MAHHDRYLELLIRNLERHTKLSEAERNAISRLPVIARHLEAGAYIIRDGDDRLDCAILVSGFALRHKLSIDGGRQIVSFHIPGEALDFQQLFLEAADHNVQALSPSAS